MIKSGESYGSALAAHHLSLTETQYLGQHQSDFITSLGNDTSHSSILPHSTTCASSWVAWAKTSSLSLSLPLLVSTKHEITHFRLLAPLTLRIICGANMFVVLACWCFFHSPAAHSLLYRFVFSWCHWLPLFPQSKQTAGKETHSCCWLF